MSFTTDKRVVVDLSILTLATCWFQKCGSPELEGKVERRIAAEI
jgi:hypothetical protein